MLAVVILLGWLPVLLSALSLPERNHELKKSFNERQIYPRFSYLNPKSASKLILPRVHE
jgi:hypothetical protein